MMKKSGLLIVIIMLLFATVSMAQVIHGTFAIINVQTGIYLRIKDANATNGTPLVAYSPVNWKCVTWDFKHVDSATYQLKNLFSGKTFQSKNAAANGVALEEQPLSVNQASQLYEFITVDKETYLIKLKGTDLYVTASDDKGTINAPVVLSKKSGNRLQYWTLKEQKPEI